MVVIRLARGGSKKSPFYHIVATDKRSPRDGRYLENVGYFNPVARGMATRLEVKQDRVDHWVSQGAQVSDRVKRLLKEFAAGLTGPKVHKPKAKPAPVKAEAEEKPAEETPAAPETPADVPAQEPADKPEEPTKAAEETPAEAPAENKPAEEAPAEDKKEDA